MQTVQLGDKRSAELEATDKRNLKALLKKAGTKTAAAGLLEISRDTLNTIIVRGTCAPSTLQSIRDFFTQNENMAA